MTDVAWGTVPDWIAAFGTAGALIAVVYGLAQERAARVKSEKRLIAERRAAEANQARLVTASTAGPWDGVAHVDVQNDSDAPIHKVEVGLLVPTGPTQFSWVHCVPLDPIKAHRVAARSPARLRLQLLTDLAPNVGAVSYLKFTDADGMEWARINNLTPLRPRYAPAGSGKVVLTDPDDADWTIDTSTGAEAATRDL
ncbi:hypothetical protein AB0H43_35525 [Hamadaea sp. NPDC050747]|uniref:hypothetical protein n=1 Tax=Hamadaea sp. NPDC050747 TaxID=3155789 RepID=UPI0033C271E2